MFIPSNTRVETLDLYGDYITEAINTAQGIADLIKEFAYPVQAELDAKLSRIFTREFWINNNSARFELDGITVIVSA